MLSFPPRSARAQAFLRRSVNDIDIYVEDAARANVWLALVRKCMPAGKKLGKVMPLGDRDAVIKACRLDQTSSRPRLYIIDGDYDFALSKSPPRLKNLYRIPATNLEAFVLMTEGLLPFIISMNPLLDPEDLKKDLESHLIKKWIPILKRLFVLYSINQQLNLGVTTSNYHVSRLCLAAGGAWEPDLSKIAQRAREVLLAARRSGQIGITRFQTLRQIVMGLPPEKTISGKTYLFPLIENYTKICGAFPGNSDKLMLGIINCGVRPNHNFCRRIGAQFR